MNYDVAYLIKLKLIFFCISEGKPSNTDSYRLPRSVSLHQYSGKQWDDVSSSSLNPLYRLKLLVENFINFQLYSLHTIKIFLFKSQKFLNRRMKYRVYKTLGTNVVLPEFILVFIFTYCCNVRCVN